jgi:hypothetical protein
MSGNCGECTRRWFCNENPETCGAFPEPPPPTNADRIRAMSDEELAKIIVFESMCEKTPFCQNKQECIDMLDTDGITEEMCARCALDWLQQPVKEEHYEAD